MRLQSVSNCNSYEQPNFQKLIVRPFETPYQRAEVLTGLESVIRNNKSIQEYAKVLEKHAELFGLPKVDLIAEYGGSIYSYGSKCVRLSTSDNNMFTIIADESDYTVPDDERSVYKQMEKFDCSHIVNAYKAGYSIQKGLMQNYLA